MIPIGSAEAKSRCSARNPSRAHEPEYAAGRAKNQLFAPRAAIVGIVPRILQAIGVLRFAQNDRRKRGYCGTPTVAGFTSEPAVRTGAAAGFTAKNSWSYRLRYMWPASSAALGPKVGRPPSRKMTVTI